MMQALDLETPSRSSDGMGGHILTWKKLGRLWARMKASPAQETTGDIGARALVRWQFVIPAARHGDPRRPVPGQRFVMGERKFLIETVSEQGGAGRELVLVAHEEEGRE